MSDPHESQADAEAWARRNARIEELVRAFVGALAVIDEDAVEHGISDALGQAIDERVIPDTDWMHVDGLLRVLFAAQRDRRFALGLDPGTVDGALDPRAEAMGRVVHLALVNFAGSTVPLASALKVLLGADDPKPARPALRVIQGGVA